MKCAIIGCGYVGSRLAELWSGKHIVTCTTTRKSHTKSSTQTQKWIIAKGTDYDTVYWLIKEHDVIIVSVTPPSIEDYRKTYLGTAETIRKAAKESKTPKRLLFLSATSVYGDQNGHWVDEKNPPNAKIPEIKHLIEAENIFLSLGQVGWNITILRLSEIYGPEKTLKDKILSLQDRPLPGSGDFYSNMIHLDDVVHVIDYALDHKWEGIYNVTDDDHPTTSEFYKALCQQYNLPQVHWDPNLQPLIKLNKRISNQTIKSAGYRLLHPHRVL
jgi:nucleoside-diphosphate-sugar epimerase